MGSLFAGSKAVLLKGTSPEIILKAVSDEQCTVVWLLVPWAQDILDALDRGDVKLSDYKLDQWRLMHIGAQPVPPSLIRRWKEYFPHTSTTRIMVCPSPPVRAASTWAWRTFTKWAPSASPAIAGRSRLWTKTATLYPKGKWGSSASKALAL